MTTLGTISFFVWTGFVAALGYLVGKKIGERKK